MYFFGLFCPNTAIQQGRCRTTRLDSLVAAASADKIMEVVEAHGERGGEVAVVEGIPVEHADAAMSSKMFRMRHNELPSRHITSGRERGSTDSPRRASALKT